MSVTHQDRTKLIKALKRSMTALDDWLNTYADDQCDPQRVAQAHERIRERGTIGYIADVQKQNREALRSALPSAKDVKGILK